MTNPGPGPVAVADFNEDGHLDFAIIEVLADQVRVAIGDGGGDFTLLEPVSLEQTSSSMVPVAGRFQGPNAAPSLVVIEQVAAELLVFANPGDGQLGSPESVAFPQISPILHIGEALDFDKDGVSDLAVGASGGVRFIHNQEGAWQLAPAAFATEACSATGIASIPTAPPNNEWVIIAGGCGGVQTGVPALHVLGQYPDGLEVVGAFATGTDAFDVTLGSLDDVEGDDVAIANRASADVTVLRRVAEVFTEATPLTLVDYCGSCSGLHKTEISDLDGDSFGDLIMMMRHISPDGLTRFGLFVLEDALSEVPQWLWIQDDVSGFVVADFNDDNKGDILVTTKTGLELLTSD